MTKTFRISLLIVYVLACYSFVIRDHHRPMSTIKSKKYECELPDGFIGPKHTRVMNKPKEPIPVTNVVDLKDLIRQGDQFLIILFTKNNIFLILLY